MACVYSLYLFYYKLKVYLNEVFFFFLLCEEHCSVFLRYCFCFGSCCGARQVSDCSGGVGFSDALLLPSLEEKELRQ